MNQFLQTRVDIKQLSWPPHNTCTGDCQQGRNCRCTVPDDEPPLTSKDARIALLLTLGAWAVPVGVLAFVRWVTA